MPRKEKNDKVYGLVNAEGSIGKNKIGNPLLYTLGVPIDWLCEIPQSLLLMDPVNSDMLTNQS